MRANSTKRDCALQQQRQQHAEQHLEQHAPERQLGLHQQRIDEARIARQQAIVAQRRAEIGRRARIGQLKRRQAGHQQIERRQHRRSANSTIRLGASAQRLKLRRSASINPASAQSVVPARRRLAIACSCAAFIASAAGQLAGHDLLERLVDDVADDREFLRRCDRPCSSRPWPAAPAPRDRARRGPGR